MIPIPRSLHPHLRWWLQEGSVLQGVTTPTQSCSSDLYRCLKRRLGRLLRSRSKRGLIPPRKQVAHKLSGGLFCPKRVPRPLFKQDDVHSNREHHSGCLQGGRHEVWPSACLTVENPELVLPETGKSQGPTHSRLDECGGRQTIPAGPDNSDRMVSPSRVLSLNMHQVVATSNRPFCNKVQQQVAPVCVTCPKLPSLCSRCTHFTLGGPGPICISTRSHCGPSHGKTEGLPMHENHSHFNWLSQHALVLGSCSYVEQDPPVPAQPALSSNATIQSDSTQESTESKSPLHISSSLSNQGARLL